MKGGIAVMSPLVGILQSRQLCWPKREAILGRFGEIDLVLMNLSD